MPPTKRQTKHPRRPGAGRPNTGIRRDYVRLEVYIPLPIRDAILRLVDRRQVASGEFVCRADVVRDALTEYLRRHLPDAGL